MKVRNGIARSYVASAARGLTVLAVSATLVLGGVVTTPVQAVAASRVSVVQAAKDRAARAARYARHRAKAAADARARAARYARHRAKAAADARARAARYAKAHNRIASAATPVAGAWYRTTVSWYGPGFYGHGMAGGGILRANSMVVAHRSLRFGTRVQFAYGGRTVIAVVRDRGPFVAGRLFDLGPGTAKAIGFDKVGVGRVQYRILP